MTLKLIRRIVAITIAVAAFIYSPGSLFASDVLIIANQDVTTDSLTRAEIKNIFIGITTLWPDKNKIIFVTLKESNVHKKFVRQYTSKSPDQFRAYWRRQLFTGKGRIPKAYQTDQDIVSFVAKTSGSIGYVSSSASIDNVKIINVSDN